MATTPLKHVDTDKKSDEQIALEARKHREDSKDTQFASELLTTLRSLKLSWWTAEELRADFSATMRMNALALRPDIRQEITTTLAGIPMKTARRMTPDLQATLLDQVIDNDDVSVERWEAEYAPDDLAVYMDITAYWRRFRNYMPWDDRCEAHQRLVQQLLEAFLKPRKSSDGKDLGQILTHHEVLSAIDPKDWVLHIPKEIHEQILVARLKNEKERPRNPFQAKDDLAIATPEVIAKNIPLKKLVGVFDAAEKAMGFDAVEEPKPVDDSAMDDKATTVAPAAATKEAVMPDIPPTDRTPAIVLSETTKPADPPKGDMPIVPVTPPQKEPDADVYVVDVDDEPRRFKDPKPGDKTPEMLKMTASLTNADFERAGGMPAGAAPRDSEDSHKSATVSTAVFEIEAIFGIDIDDIPDGIGPDLKTLFVDKTWIDDEERIRKALIFLFPLLDKARYPKDSNAWKSKISSKQAIRTELKNFLMTKPNLKAIREALFPPPPQKPR